LSAHAYTDVMTAKGRDEVVGRRDVVETLTESLRKAPFIHAMWEGGAAAEGTLDEWSDIDLYVLVDDDKVEQAFTEVETALSIISPINLKLPVPDTGWPGVHQAFYKLADASEYHVIDLAVITRSAKEKFLEPKVHGEAVFYFNKVGEIEFEPFDESAAMAAMRKRRKRLADRLEVFGCFFQKEVNRGNLIEAVDLYHRLFLSTLVELLRMEHNPDHYSFGTRHVHTELPRDVVDRLERLCFVRDGTDLRKNHREISEWIEGLLGRFE
jgi:predicted nucleotidyltransferase